MFQDGVPPDRCVNAKQFAGPLVQPGVLGVVKSKVTGGGGVGGRGGGGLGAKPGGCGGGAGGTGEAGGCKGGDGGGLQARVKQDASCPQYLSQYEQSIVEEQRWLPHAGMARKSISGKRDMRAGMDPGKRVIIRLLCADMHGSCETPRTSSTSLRASRAMALLQGGSAPSALTPRRGTPQTPLHMNLTARQDRTSDNHPQIP